jgi:hypothetical protein
MERNLCQTSVAAEYAVGGGSFTPAYGAAATDVAPAGYGSFLRIVNQVYLVYV